MVLVGGTGPVTARLQAAAVPFAALEHLRRPVNPWNDARAFTEVADALRRFRPDLVSTHTAKAGWVGRAAAHRLGIPVIYTPHGWSLGDRVPGLRGHLFGAAERLAAGWADAIVCVCESERRVALAHGIGKAGQLTVIHNGVRDVPADLRADPARPRFRMISVARFEHPKDPLQLLHALAPLVPLDWHLDLVGDGPLEPKCRELAGRLGLDSRIRFRGYSSDVAGLLANAQLFVLCSHSEAFPRSVLEAMRAGLPVVASDVGGIREAVDNGVNGLLVTPGEPAALSAALNTLWGDPGMRQRFGAAARLTFESRFRLEPMIQKTAALYETVWNQDARRRSQV